MVSTQITNKNKEIMRKYYLTKVIYASNDYFALEIVTEKWHDELLKSELCDYGSLSELKEISEDDYQELKNDNYSNPNLKKLHYELYRNVDGELRAYITYQ